MTACALTIPLDRFDLVFLILDPQDEQYDKKLGRHLVSLYFKDESAEEEEFFSMKVSYMSKIMLDCNWK